MNCLVEEKPSGSLIATTILASLIKDQTCNNNMDQLGGSQADHMLLPINLKNNLFSFSSSLWDSTLSKYWLGRLSQHVCVVTAIVCRETQSPSDWSMTHFILSKLPCGWRGRGHGGTKAVSWWVWLWLNPGTLWGLPFQRTLIQQGELACLLTGLPVQHMHISERQGIATPY